MKIYLIFNDIPYGETTFESAHLSKDEAHRIANETNERFEGIGWLRVQEVEVK